MRNVSEREQSWVSLLLASHSLTEHLIGCLQGGVSVPLLYMGANKAKNPNPCDLQHLHMQGFPFLFSVVGLLICQLLMGEVVLFFICLVGLMLLVFFEFQLRWETQSKLKLVQKVPVISIKKANCGNNKEVLMLLFEPLSNIPRETKYCAHIDIRRDTVII